MSHFEQLSSVKRVLAVRIGHLGDSVLATTVIEPLRAACASDVQVDFASGPDASAAVLRLDRRIHRVFPIRRRRLHWRLEPGKRALQAHARRTPYDLVLNLECGPECDDFARFLRPRLYWGSPEIRRSHTPAVHCVDTEKSIYRDLLGAAAVDAAEPGLDLGSAAPLELPALAQPYVLLNPGFAGLGLTGYRGHRGWPLEHWQELARRLTQASGLTVAVNGTAAEEATLAPLLYLPGVVSLVGTSLEQLVSAIRGAHAVISVDTGTMHLAAALGTPLVALFGPTIPALTGPYSRSSPCKVLTSGIDCQPCDRTPAQKRCSFNRCMTELLPGAVLKAVDELLSS